MGWNEKGLIKKLKTGMVGLGIIGASYFNANAQENPENSTQNHNHEYFYEKGNEFKKQENYNRAIDNYTQAINIVKNIRKNEFESLKIDSLKELEARYLVDRAIAFRKLFDLDNVMLDLERVKNLKESISQKDYNPKYNNYVYEAIKIRDKEKDFYPDFKTLDELIDNSKTYIKQKNTYTKKEISEISEKIYTDILKKSYEMKDIIDKCYRMSMVYLAISEENDLHLYPVIIPNHIFVRYDPDGKHDPLNPNNPINKGDINIETTTGKIKIDQEIFSLLISKKSLEKRIYLSNLNEKEFLSIAHWNRAIEKIEKENYQEALEECNKAIELNLNSLQAYSIRSGCYGYLGEFKKSIEDLNKAIELNPEPDLFCSKAFVLSKLKKYDQALENYNKAINLIEEIRKNEKDTLVIVSLKKAEINHLIERAIVHKNLGGIDNSFQDMKKAKSLSDSIENNETESSYYLILKEKDRKNKEYIRTSILD